jgi:XRE family aerobic/anaerobic benzoate catabolism transcriptional regulator
MLMAYCCEWAATVPQGLLQLKAGQAFDEFGFMTSKLLENTPVPRLTDDSSDYLHALGEHIRDLRVRRGMTRTILARDSGVSLRYLAQLEGGEGNISILRLRQIAQAMAMPLEEVIRVGPEQPAELTLLWQFLARLSPVQLVEARGLLRGAFEQTHRRNRIALIGLRGAGKSSLGRRLAAHLKIPFIELADIIEQTAGVPLSEVFSLYGQAAYRRYERRSLEWLVETYDNFVLSTGGSISTEPATFDELLASCYTVWLRASPADHMARVVAQGDQRPMGDNREAMKDLERILVGREPMYRKADAIVNTSGLDIEQSLDEIIKQISV